MPALSSDRNYIIYWQAVKFLTGKVRKYILFCIVGKKVV
jgi:hypothetical protein